MRKLKGFTLIELLVVIAIIALLLAILMPSLRMAKEHAKRLLCGKDLSSIGVALAMYAGQEDDELPKPVYGKSVNTYYFGRYGPASNAAALHAGPADVRLVGLLTQLPPGAATDDSDDFGATNLGYLMKEDLIDRSYPKIFYCASNKSGFSFEGYGGEAEWPLGSANPAGVNPTRIRISYAYLPQHRYKKNPDLPDFPATAKKYSEMDPSRSVVMDLLDGNDMAHKSSSLLTSAGYVGVNILYGDGSTIFKRDEGNVIKNAGDVIGSESDKQKPFRQVIKALE